MRGRTIRAILGVAVLAAGAVCAAHAAEKSRHGIYADEDRDW